MKRQFTTQGSVRSPLDGRLKANRVAGIKVPKLEPRQAMQGRVKDPSTDGRFRANKVDKHDLGDQPYGKGYGK